MSGQTFLLPDLGEGLTEAEVVRWLVEEGDTVEVDQPVVEVETAKSLVEVPSPYAGRVATRHAAEGVTLEVGKPLLTVAALVAEAETYREEEQAGSGNVLIGYGTSGATATSRRRRPRARQAPAVTPHRVPLVVSPLVRRLARDGGLDLSTVPASGAGGVITRADVERALARPGPAAAPVAAAAAPAPVAAPVVAGERRIPLTGFRKAVSAALTRSRAEIPEATVWVDVDATKLWELRQSTPGPGLLAYLARFVVAGLRQYPMLNARVDTERQEIVEFDRINLGIAVQGERGLVVPAVVGAETMTTGRLDEEIRRVTAAAREGRVTAQESGTFTLNNYGSFRVDGSAAIINHPQVAILGFGRILDRPWVVDGELCVRKITQMSFVFDHRVCDGGTAAGFMRSVADAIEDPASAIARL
jgi:pyruvate dehydrogenase E2 component (dihydrolipoamide acetyltransferase)